MFKYVFNLLVFAGLSITFNSSSTYSEQSSFSPNIPSDFVEVRSRPPNVNIEVRYASAFNFVGKPIDGYKAEKIFLTKVAADSLKRAINILDELGYGIILYDGYRPQKAVDMFVTWSQDLNDTLTKQDYYPNEVKKNLFKLGYIASKSGHSRGSTVDLGLVHLPNGEVVDMGTNYDFFGPESSPLFKEISKEHRERRLILRNAMLLSGFKPIESEWWHFTLQDEPYPDTYFNFDIE